MDDVRPKMRFSLSPSPPKAIFSSTLISGYRCSSDHFSFPFNAQHHNQNRNNKNFNNTVYKKIKNMQHQQDTSLLNFSQADEETSSDYKQWLHAMKLVARLPGGIPPEFRRKLWLSLADKYLKSKNVDWSKEEEKCFCDKWREDDEELGIQIVKDLHRTGSTLCTGPAGDINQAKLKKILLGYARYNPEVGYCQGFNMLGALILQVMDKEESESIKIMIYLVEGILPAGYFCGSMCGLQADMAVFRDLMQTKLPRLAKHLQKLQGPIENAYEPPLTNVFTMQWFLTMFCTCLPMSCVLRVWDLVLIEGSDVLLRTALVLWSLLEERVLSARSADDFYGKMGSFSTELLNGHLIDSNGLIEKVVQLGPIADLQKLRDKHLHNIAPLKPQQGLQLYFDEEETDIDEDSRLAVATVWGIPWGRRGSQSQSNNLVTKQPLESKDRIALDISLLKKQYDRLRERQKQAHIILTTACSTARQSGSSSTSNTPLPVNQLLSGRSAIITNKGRRSGPPAGAIPPARKPSLPVALQEKTFSKQLLRGETLNWRDADGSRQRRDSITWKEIKAERAALITSESFDGFKSQKIRTRRLGKSDSSSYSEESDDNDVAKDDASSTDTSLCDDEFQQPEVELKKKVNAGNKKKSLNKNETKNGIKYRNMPNYPKEDVGRIRPRSWAPSNSDIPFVLMAADSSNNSADENLERDCHESKYSELQKEKVEEKFSIENMQIHQNESNNFKWQDPTCCPLTDNQVMTKHDLPIKTDSIHIDDMKSDEVPMFTSMNSIDREHADNIEIKSFDVSEAGVTNEYFERVNSSERPKRLDLLYSLNEEDSIRNAFKIEKVVALTSPTELPNQSTNNKSTNYIKNTRRMDLLVDYSEKSSAAYIEEAKSEISTTFQTSNVITSIPIKKEINTSNTVNHIVRKPKGSAEKRKDPRRLTLTRSSTMDIEKRYQALEKRLSMDICSKYKVLCVEKEPHSEYLNDISKNLVVDNELSTSSKIPSTAELEERFKKIELVLNRDRNVHINSLCDSEKNSKETNIKNTNSESQSQSQSPTNNSLDGKESLGENKNNNDHSENDNKNNTDAKNASTTPSDDKNHSSTINEELESKNSENDVNLQKQNDSEGSRTIIAKTNELESEKEPPDDMQPEEKRHEAESETFSNDRDKQISVREDPQNTENSVITDSETLDNNLDSIQHPPLDKIKTVEGEECKTNEKSSENSSRRTSNQKKSPPSTEELERRFSALAEQMTCTKGDLSGSQKDLKEENQMQSTSIPIDPNKKMTSSNNEHTNITQSDQKDLNIKMAKTDAVTYSKTDVHTAKQELESNTKRRLSEPPSTEDLEQRYEILKRRMSSRNFETRSLYRGSILDDPEKLNKPQFTRSSTANKREENIPSSSNNHSPPSIEDLEERFEKLNSKNELRKTPIKENPPSTENEENRFQKLQIKNDQHETTTSTNNSKIVQSGETSDQAKPTIIADMKNNDADKKSLKDGDDDDKQLEQMSYPSKTIEHSEASISNDKPIKMRLIEELQKRIKENSINLNSENVELERNVQKKRAVIEEFKKNVKPVHDDFVKPSQIPSKRRAAQSNLLASHSFNDETLESHAASAYHRSGKYEPLNSPNRKTVRRFSDLPSRADLENRLQFLEEQLSKTVSRQRRASDSEVSSQSRSKFNVSRSNVTQNNNLENRVRELEKRLKDATPTVGEDNVVLKEKLINEQETGVSQKGSASDSVAVTGKELVRYSSYGEVDDIERQNPINISINIQMTLNKDDICDKNGTEISKTEELDRRLKLLEEQLKSSIIYVTDAVVQPSVSGHQSSKNTASNEQKPTEEEKRSNEIENESIKEKLEDSLPERQSSQPNATDSKSSECKQKESAIRIEENVKGAKPENEHCIERSAESKEQTKIEDTMSEQTSGKKILCQEENTPKITETAQSKHDENIEKIKEKENIQEKPPKTECKTHEPQAIQSTAKENTDNGNQEPTENIKLCNLELKETSESRDLCDKSEKPKNESDNEIEAVAVAVGEKENATELHTPVTENQIKTEKITKNTLSDNSSNAVSSTQFMPVEINKKTLVLLLDNEPKAVKVRRLTRANTEELEDLFQALEKQLNSREGQVNNDLKKEKTNSEVVRDEKETETSRAMTDLAKEIESYTKSELNISESKDKTEKSKKTKHEEEFDWGNDPIKFHLKKRTVYLPSTKELEARFRSLERQIKLLEDVEKIDVEQRLLEIERKIKLQYSLSHEKDLNKFLDLCEGKGLDDTNSPLENHSQRCECCKSKPHAVRQASPNQHIDSTQPVNNPKYQQRAGDLKRSKSKQNLKKQPIHPLEMLLDPSPDDSDIPTTGELEHRIRVMEERHRTPSPSSQKSCSQSPSARTKQNKTKPNTHVLETMTLSPTERELPTAEELEARLEALEKEQCFNYKMQKNFQQFNQKLKAAVSPSLSFDEFKSSNKPDGSETKQPSNCSATKQTSEVNTGMTSKTIRFKEREYSDNAVNEKKSGNLQSAAKGSQQMSTSHEGLGVMGIRLMRETSPLRRKGTHTGVPLRTGENINDQLMSIQNTIKSIDTLCEEKPYRKERCQQYIDSLFSDSAYFAHKKSSLDDLTSRNLNQLTSREIGGPAIRISEHSPTFSRSMGSAESIRSSSPLRSTSPLQYRSNRELRREPSPRRRHNEDREEHESRVRRDNLLPNNINYNNSTLSHTSHSSLTKFHKVDSQLIENDVKYEESLRHPILLSSINTTLEHDNNTNTSNSTTEATTTDKMKIHLPVDRPISPYRLTALPNTNSPVYTPAKLEIRHTTVTSTFYDRVMTEKQLEKQQQQHSLLSNNRSPMISPLYERQINQNLHTDLANSGNTF